MSDTPVQQKNPDLTRSFHTRDESAESTKVPKDAPSSGEALPERIGDYRIIGLLGQGGMGAVYRAEDIKLQREVALKVMRPDIAANPVSKDRFLREARAVAALKHDHIVSIYQVGEEDGVPFLAMELLEGMSLHDYLNSGKPLGWLDILRIGRDIAGGLALAHSKGMIHRDIKPGNIWLETLNQSAESVDGPAFRVNILDFGLARPISDGVHLTAFGVLIGTPGYMAPEQASGDTSDGRCDLFSLGVLLYKLCSGRLPFEGKNVLEVLNALAVKTPEALSSLNPDVPVKLQHLIDRLLAKKPDDRPASAQLVVAELQAIMNEVAVGPARGASIARPDDYDSQEETKSLTHQAKRPRDKIRLRIAMTFFGLLIAIGSAIIVLKGRDGKEKQVDAPGENTAIVRPAPKLIVDSPEVKQFESPPQPEGPVMVDPGEPLTPRTFVSRPLPIPGVRSWTIEPISHIGTSTSVAWSSDGLHIATGGFGDCSIRLWSPKGQLQKVLLGHDQCVLPVEFSPDSKFLVSASADLTVRLWDVENGACLRVFPIGQMGQQLAFSPSGETLAVATTEGLVLIEIGSATVRTRSMNKAFRGAHNTVAWLSDKSRILTRGSEEKFLVLKTDTLETLAELEMRDQNGKTVACAAISCSSDGKWFAGAGVDGLIRIWDAKSLELKRTIGDRNPNQDQYVFTLKWSKDNRRLLSSVGPGTAYTIWDALNGKPLVRSKMPGVSYAVAWSASENEVACVSSRLRIGDARTGEERQVPVLGNINHWVSSQYVAQENAFAFTSGSAIVFHDVDTGRELRRLENVSGSLLSVSPKGDRIALLVDPVSPNPHVALIDSSTGMQQCELKPPTKGEFNLEWSPDGRWIATSHLDGIIRIWNSETSELKHQLKAHDGPVYHTLWSRDGKRLASLGLDKTIQIWDPFAENRLNLIKDLPAPFRNHFPPWNRSTLVWVKQGQSLGVLFEREFAVVDVATGKWIEKKSPTTTPVGLNKVSSSPDGNHLLLQGNLAHMGRVWVRGRDSTDIFEVGYLGIGLSATWLPDSRRFYSQTSPCRSFDSQTKRYLGTFFADIDGESMVIGPDGYFRGNENVEKSIAYVVQLEDGSNITLSPAEFAYRFNWKNDPSKARFLKLDE